MMENDSEKTSLRPTQKNKPYSNMLVVGLNLLVMVVYTIAFRFVKGGFIFDAFVILVHLIVCVVVALVKNKDSWTLSGLLVLLIAFSTCYGVLLH